MPDTDDQMLAKARVCFDTARRAAETNDFDYAIDAYLEGLRYAPDAVQEGHIPLRELALLRQAKGGEKPSTEQAAERLQGETALEQMLGAEYLLAKDPTHLPYGEAILKAAVAGGYKETARWIADLVFLANNRAKKPSLQIYRLLKDSYASIGQFDRAAAACECATRLIPEDKDLADELKRLSDESTAARGKYDQEADFSESIEMGQEQEKLKVGEGVVRSRLDPVPEEHIDAALARAIGFFNKARQVAEVGD